MEKHITAPITKETAKSLHAGDYVYVTGTIYTARDAAHKRMDEALDRGEELPIDIKNQAIYYMGPSPAREGLASYYAAKNASPDGLARLQHILDLQEFYFEKRDAEHLREMDDQFHDIICDMSGHAVISDTLVPLHRKTRRYRKASIADAKRTAQVVKEHRAIYVAIAAGDADAAAALTTEHTIHAKKSMIERMDHHG